MTKKKGINIVIDKAVLEKIILDVDADGSFSFYATAALMAGSRKISDFNISSENRWGAVEMNMSNEIGYGISELFRQIEPLIGKAINMMQIEAAKEAE